MLRPHLRIITQHPLFWWILILKLIMGIFLGSTFIRDLFAPFVHFTAMHPLSNPWDYFHASGHVKNFPYHLGLLFPLAITRTLLLWLPDAGYMVTTFVDFFAIRLVYLVADLLIYLVLTKIFPNRIYRILCIYWASPLVFYAVYFHGQVDLVPISVLILSMYYLYRNRLNRVAILCGLAIGMKTTAILVVPIFFIYLLKNRGTRNAIQFASVCGLTSAFLIFPLIASEGYQNMVLKAEEQSWLFSLKYYLPYTQAHVLFAPAVLAIIIIRFTYFPKINFDLMVLYVGLCLGVIVLLTPPMPGWYLWMYFSLIFFVVKLRHIALMSWALLHLAYVLYFLVFAPTADLFDGFQLVIPAVVNLEHPLELLKVWNLPTLLLKDLSITFLNAMLVIHLYWLYKAGIHSNQIFQPRKQPLIIGVAGDSGTGKDTFCHLITELMGDNRFTRIDGDDYHKWERGDENWKILTHCHVQSNKLHEQMQDINGLAFGETIEKVHYDHGTGRFTKRQSVNPNDFLFINGLHTFYLEDLRNLIDLKVFMLPDEQIRRFWKIQRDVKERQHSPQHVDAEIKRRLPDSQKYIYSQARYSDIVFSYQLMEPLNEKAIELEQLPPIQLLIEGSNSFYWEGIVQRLKEEKNLSVDHEMDDIAVRQKITISGDISQQTLIKLASETTPNLHELVTETEAWSSGLNGIVQLITILGISHKMRLKRDRNEGMGQMSTFYSFGE